MKEEEEKRRQEEKKRAEDLRKQMEELKLRDQEVWIYCRTNALLSCVCHNNNDHVT